MTMGNPYQPRGSQPSSSQQPAVPTNPYARKANRYASKGPVGPMQPYVPQRWQPQPQRPFGQPARQTPQHKPKRGRVLLRGVVSVAVFVALLWSVFFIDVLFFNGNLAYFGIQPRDVNTVWHIATAPFLHANMTHLVSNTMSGMVFCFLIALTSTRSLLEVTAIAAVVAGLGTWLIGGVGTVHIGASGVIYGWVAYLVLRGVFNLSWRQTILGVILALTYTGLIYGLLPGTPGISWQGHLFGALGGAIAAATITSDDPPAKQARRERRRQARMAQAARARR